jgi:hypothetical protein
LSSVIKVCEPVREERLREGGRKEEGERERGRERKRESGGGGERMKQRDRETEREFLSLFYFKPKTWYYR